MDSAFSKFSYRFRLPHIALAALCLLFAACGETGDEGLADDSLAVGVPYAADTMMDADDPTAGTANPASQSDDRAEENIFDLLRGDSRFSTFVSILDSAGLGPTLAGPGPFTVFAPTNEAMEAAETDLGALLNEENQDRLRDILLHHISNGETMASDLSSSSIRSLSGEDLQVTGTDDSLMVDDAQLLEPNIEASNGVVHAVGRVLLQDQEDDLI